MRRFITLLLAVALGLGAGLLGRRWLSKPVLVAQPATVVPAIRPGVKAEVPVPEVECVGYAIIGHGLPRVWLSDGTMLTERDGIREIKPNYVLMGNGKKYRVQRSRVVPMENERARPAKPAAS
jgi:hypothetical protein